ncbi:hypothetical protein ACETRX_15910 [Labrys portucalensis]|uniref:Uncharacterized protein n=1 Tax=Labrys neptuniae TaxID=376174 RepID=A0ABV6ZG43_9HYPH
MITIVVAWEVAPFAVSLAIADGSLSGCNQQQMLIANIGLSPMHGPDADTGVPQK